VKIIHLYHSGILIETEENQLFFDVISDVKNIIDRSKNVFFFVTHAHADHYMPEIFYYRSNRTNYILSDDVNCDPAQNIMFVKPNRIYQLGEMEILTYASTDKGVAFLVKIDGKVIFHAGDLNWWHWENSTEENQKEEELNYKKIVDAIEDNYIDYAFVPVDDRLGEAYYYAAKYFLDTKKIGSLIPIHFRENFHICNQLYNQLGEDKRILLVKCKNDVLNNSVIKI